jgi:hypothetical protein
MAALLGKHSHDDWLVPRQPYLPFVHLGTPERALRLLKENPGDTVTNRIALVLARKKGYAELVGGLGRNGYDQYNRHRT